MPGETDRITNNISQDIRHLDRSGLPKPITTLLVGSLISWHYVNGSTYKYNFDMTTDMTSYSLIPSENNFIRKR